MYPAMCRGRALDSYLFTAVLNLSACASAGPGAPATLASGVQPVTAPIAAPRANAPNQASAPKRQSSAPVHRRVVVDSAALEVAVTKRLAHRPLAAALSRHIRSPELADRVASAVVHEADRARISPSVLAAVLIIENARFDTSAISTEGAIGLMQVMPMHVGSYRCLSGDLLNVEANICHGARLLHSHLRRTKSIEVALRRYNGCVRGRNTPRCQRYPGRVLRTAGRLRRDILVAGTRLSSESHEGGDVYQSNLGALPPDTETGAIAAGEPAKCDSFLGCLKHRWSRSR